MKIAGSLLSRLKILVKMNIHVTIMKTDKMKYTDVHVHC